MKTAFAPAERATAEEISRQYEKLAQLPFVRDFLDAVPNMSVVLNTQRQIVFANRAFTRFLGIDNAAELLGRNQCEAFGCLYKDILGQRPGEAVGCIRSGLTEGGCGTTVFCQTCGAVISILNSQKLRTLDIQECRMLCAGEGGDHNALDLRVWSRPIDVDGDGFTVFSVVDISDEKRRKALERIFFHDVLNTASGVQGLADLLVEEGLPEEEVHELSWMISDTVEQLIEEINAQRILSAAESGDLEVAAEPLHSLELLARVVRQFHASSYAKGKFLRINADAEAFDFQSDPVLLRRVLINLVKNALEAVPEGGLVTLDCRTEGDHIAFTVHDALVMPPEVQMQLFTRSFSTKGTGRGLGTYSIKLITEKYLHGKASFVSNAESGTVFTMRYPRSIQSSAGMDGK
ncbi:MAG: GHKL domain-containing protein [Kiritimatiellales bacterium]|nr:GHKL domain-containing protein [Kiritimatiellales bacterium]MCF7863400.1 GHKL domain-containing protein [Kiritimatiellales bacterium]